MSAQPAVQNPPPMGSLAQRPPAVADRTRNAPAPPAASQIAPGAQRFGVVGDRDP
jgi:hypothetical protein